MKKKRTTKKTSTPAILTEDRSPAKLIQDFRPVQLQLTEKGESGKCIVRGEFARVGTPTENKRVYTSQLWERELGRLTKAIKERKVMGEVDHPSDGRTQLSRVSHIVTNLEEKDGIIVGEAEILDTDRGKNLKALLQSNAKIGVSSRGYGSTKANDKGEEVVQDDYRLLTFDFVAEPADSTAYPEVFFEGKELVMPTLSETTLEELKKARPDLVEAIEKEGAKPEDPKAEPKTEATAVDTQKVVDEAVASAKAETEKTVRESMENEFSKRLIETVEEVKGELREEVRKELLENPEVAGAHTALLQMKDILRPLVLPEDAEAVVKEREDQIAELKRLTAEAEEAAKKREDEFVAKMTEMGATIESKEKANADLLAENTKLKNDIRLKDLSLFVEQTLAGDEHASFIRKMVGDIESYAKKEDIEAKIESVRDELSKFSDKQAEIEEAKKGIATAKNDQIDKLNEDVGKLKDALEKTLSASKTLTLQLYTEKKTRNHPQGAKIRAIVEAGKVESKEEVDSLIEEYRQPERDPEEISETRARIRDLTRGGVSKEPAEEERRPLRRVEEDFMGLGVPLTELKELSGIRRN